jgi:hypothetical protein
MQPLAPASAPDKIVAIFQRTYNNLLTRQQHYFTTMHVHSDALCSRNRMIAETQKPLHGCYGRIFMGSNRSARRGFEASGVEATAAYTQTKRLSKTKGLQ